MIVDKKSPPEDPTPPDAPPSYETLDLASTGFRDSRATPESPSPSSSRAPDLAPVPKSTSRPGSSSKGKGRANTSWFNFSASRTAREVRTTVLGLVRDLVRYQHHNPTASVRILESCADACSSYSLSFSSLLQEKSIESHTPLYWAIVKRPPDINEDSSAQIPDLLTALLSYSTPLTLGTISEVRLACLLTSDQLLFQRLRLSPEFSPLSGTDEMLLGGTIPPDEISVEDIPGDEGSFAVDFEIPHFQRRMNVSKEIVLEFIARARMWRLAFIISPDRQDRGARAGSWCISLSLLETSPPTWIDSRLVIPEPIHLPLSPQSDTDRTLPESPPVQRSPSSVFSLNLSRGPKPRPTINLRIKSNQQLVPPQNRHQGATEIIVSLEDSLMGSSLQYSGSSYIAADEKLRARLEARLAKPEVDCVIC